MANEDEYVTLTVVVRRDESVYDPCDILSKERTDVLFVGHEDGVTTTALMLGANPSEWA